MKKTGIAVLAAGTLISWIGYICANPAQITSPVLQKTKAPKYTDFVVHSNWPAKAAISQRQYKGDIKQELTELSKCLKQVVRPKYLPSDSYVREKTIGLKELRDNNDYLLLQYTVDSRIDIQVQDGKLLYLLVYPKVERKDSSDDTGAFVSEIAGKVLNIPIGKSGKAIVPKVFISNIGLDNAKVGNLTYGDFQKTRVRDWYSNIRWWSDGKRVLFEIGKASDWKTATEAASPPPGYYEPRRFHSRMKNAH